jgi:PAS domain-containing protein
MKALALFSNKAAANRSQKNARSTGGAQNLGAENLGAQDLGAQDLGVKAADMSAQLSALRAIVDDLDYGIVVLDQERRVQFINRAFRRFWRVPDELAESKPTFIKLMYHGRGIEAYAVSHDRLGDYVAKQLALIRTGEERPLNIELRNGAAQWRPALDLRQRQRTRASGRCARAARLRRWHDRPEQSAAFSCARRE